MVQVGEVDADGREAQQALEWVRGGLAEVLREKRDAEQQGRRFEEETKVGRPTARRSRDEERGGVARQSI